MTFVVKGEVFLKLIDLRISTYARLNTTQRNNFLTPSPSHLCTIFKELSSATLGYFVKPWNSSCVPITQT